MIILLGYIRTAIYIKKSKTNTVEASLYNVEVRGKVNDINFYQKNNQSYMRVIIEVENIFDYGYKLINKPKYVRINLKRIEPIKFGDYVEIETNILPIQEQIFINSYNPKREYYFQEIGAMGNSGEVIAIERPFNLSYRDKFYNIRNEINDNIIERLGQKNGSLLGSFITGIRGKISASDYESILNAGLVHLIAISGMNMAITMGMVFVFFRRLLVESVYLTNKFEIKKLCAFMAIITGFLYLNITGFPVSAVRAYIMSCLFFVGIIIDKEPDIMRFLTFAAIYLLMEKPNLVFDVGFQFSFLAVIGLISVFNLLKQYNITFFTTKWYLKPYYYILTMLVSTITCELFILPLGIYTFNTFAPLSLLANLIAIPLTTLITIPFATISLLLFPVGLEKIALLPADWSLDILLKLSQWVSNNSQIIYVASPPIYVVLIILFGIMWFSLWQEKWRFIGVVIIFIGILMGLFYKQPKYVFDERDNLIVLNENDKIYFSNNKNKFKNKVIANKFGKKEYEILDKKDLELVENMIKNTIETENKNYKNEENREYFYKKLVNETLEYNDEKIVIIR